MTGWNKKIDTNPTRVTDWFYNFINRDGLSSFLNDGEKIGFRIQFFCSKCKTIMSPHRLVDGCPKCTKQLDLSLR